MSSIPAGSVISSAQLEGFVEFANGGSMTGDYAVFQLVQPWTEDGSTWENAKTDKKWANAGGDFVSKALGKVTWPRSNGNTWIKFNVLPLIQNFVKFPDINNGMLVRNVSGTQEIRFPSSEDSSVEMRPKLTITYEEGASTLIPKRTFAVKGVALNAVPYGLRLDVDGNASAILATVSRMSGRQLVRIHIPAGNSRSVTGLGAGVYIITFKQNGRTERTSVSIVQ